MLTDTLFSQIDPLMIFKTILLILGMYFINKAYHTYSQEITWLNENPLALKQISLFAEKYSIKNMINRDEVLVCISTDDYESMDNTAKSKLYEFFVTDSLFELHEISPVQYGSFERLTLKECFEQSIPIFLSCVPFFSHGTFIVQDFSRRFRRLYDTKTQRKNDKALMYMIGACICAVAVWVTL